MDMSVTAPVMGIGAGSAPFAQSIAHLARDMSMTLLVMSISATWRQFRSRLLPLHRTHVSDNPGHCDILVTGMAVMCLPRSQLGSCNLARLGTAGCSTQEPYKLR